MILLSKPLAPDEPALIDYYRRCARHGSVFRSRVRRRRYGIFEGFDPAWGVAAVCWCVGGTERYEFAGGSTVRLRAGAVLVIGELERYAYSARSERPFLTSMIAFPQALTRSLGKTMLDQVPPDEPLSPRLRTRVFTPQRGLMERMNRVAGAVHDPAASADLLEEQVTLLAFELVAAQARDDRRPERLDAVKKATREELCRRLRRAVAMMHEAYPDPGLGLAALAREACIARHHFVRVFADAYGLTPLRYLGRIRMQAAADLLETMDDSAAEVARAVGFASRPAFQRRFRQWFGMPPAAWRERRRRGH